LLDLTLDHTARTNLAQIDRAATRARNVVRQILTFGRRQPQNLTLQPLRPLVEEVLSLLHATVPSVVRLEPSLAEEPIHALIDTTQMHQVLINLCTNAWHSLQGSTGRIQIGLELLQLDANEAVRIGTMAAGPHAHIWVIDNGCGMDPATKARIFEPFFTTKAAGEGTGLGLSVVHGIVADHHGAITVDSSPGKGSAFHLYFPAQSGPESGTSPDEPEAAFAAAGRGERVVYIDDDEVMRLMVGRLLERSGFQPTCHQAASVALAAIRSQPDACDVVVTDFNMPELSGIDVAAALAALRPDLPVIISSGYISDELRASAAQCGVKALLAKENTFEELAGLILQVLGAHQGAA
jgi:CheY-like chemotaxis protein